MRNVILTGIPRSGTTLAASIIDSLPDTVCLNEPDWQVSKVTDTGKNFAKWLVGDFAQTRQKLLSGEPITDRRSQEGEAVTNYFLVDPASKQTQRNFKKIPFTRSGLSPDFTLAIKHNGPYLAALKPIVELNYFTVIAIVREPIGVIHSWRSVDLPISRGDLPTAKHYWPRMAELIAHDIDLLEKQVKMYDLMCERLYEQRERIHLLPYETLLKEPQLIAECLGADVKNIASAVTGPSRQVPDVDRQAIAELVRRHGKFIAYFYPDI